jgi:type II secretory pathway component PulF
MIKRALTYPLVLLVLCFGVVVFILTFVFPKFSALFAEIWDVLPVSTKILMKLSDLMLSYWYIFLVGTLILYLFLWWVLKQNKVRLCMDRFKISLPVVGKLFVMIYTAQMLRILGFLIKGSVPLLESLTITREIVGNIFYKNFIGNIIEAAQEGKGIAHTFLQTDFIPETVKQVVKTGEDSSRLDFVMIRLADYYDNEIEQQLQLCTFIIEPLALIVMGGFVGFIVMSIVMPIFKLTKAVH